MLYQESAVFGIAVEDVRAPLKQVRSGPLRWTARVWCFPAAYDIQIARVDMGI